ncbi:MAG: SulP family inorganic anion transporter [Chloroflexi bacterium]|nr:SulP family inorganic anion transporter [Chloroflexota bacterium]
MLGLLRREFKGYNAGIFQADLIAGLTVAAVALPLALAFGVVSGADAASGLVTAILAGLLIGGLGGGPYQISGPTGAMSAVLLVIAAKHGMPGVWVAGVMAGILILLMAIFKLGRIISFIPSPVIVGFTSGIAVIIGVGQFPNVFGTAEGGSEGVTAILAGYVVHGLHPDIRTVTLAGVVAASMVILPKLFPRLPASLVGIALATVLAQALGWTVPIIGEIPRTILLDHRLTPDLLTPGMMLDVTTAAVSIAILGAVESLLCGAVAGNMTGIRMDNRIELYAQALGNIVIPFFGGVPSTAAIARTSVGIKSGGRTRMVSIIHSVALLVSALVAAPLIAEIPLAALGGVLVVTAVRMNEWEAIRFFVHRRLWHALAAMVVTLLATVVLDLTQAIILGIGVSAVLFLRQASAIVVSHQPVDVERLVDYPVDPSDHDHTGTRVVYVTGPLFFASVSAFLDAIEGVASSDHLILSLRGMPTIDHMGVEAIREVIERQRHGGGDVQLAGLQPSVRDELERSGVLAYLGEDRIHWSADKAILAAATTSRDQTEAEIEEDDLRMLSATAG